MRAARGRSFKVSKWELYVERQARLQNKRPGEDRGGRFHPDGLVTYVFSRLRCKPTASALAVGLCSGAGVARRRAHDDLQDMMSDTSTSTMTTAEQFDKQTRLFDSRQHHPDVMGGGVQCEGGTPHTPARRNGRLSPSTRRTVVRVLPCEGCEGSNPNYRVVRERAPAPARLSMNRVWTPHTPHTLPRRGQNSILTPSPAGLALEKCEGGQTPQPITRQSLYTLNGGGC